MVTDFSTLVFRGLFKGDLFLSVETDRIGRFGLLLLIKMDKVFCNLSAVCGVLFFKLREGEQLFDRFLVSGVDALLLTEIFEEVGIC